MRRRIAFVDYFPTHYRKRLYEALARRTEADFYFFADERERYWNRKLDLVCDGDFRRVELPRMRIGGNAVMPTLPLRMHPGRYDAVIKSLNGKLMLPMLYGAARARGLPFVLWTGMWYHPNTPFHRASRPITEALYRDVDAIVCYGEHVKRFVGEVPSVDPAKLFVAGQAVEPERFEAVQPRYNGVLPEVLFIGQFEERKGLHDLLAATDRLRGELPFRLRLVGNGSLEEEIRRRAADHGDIELVGFIPQHELPAQLERSRCLVLPSITTNLDREPWGLVVNEAMHAGLPVVATDGVGAAAGGLLRDGQNGFVVPERRPEALAEALRRLLTEADLAAKLGARAREDAAAFTHERMAEAFEAAIEHAIAAHGR